MTRLRLKREESGLMQAELAMLAKVSAPFMCDLEAGRRNALPDTWERIANALGCEVGDIIEQNPEVQNESAI